MKSFFYEINFTEKTKLLNFTKKINVFFVKLISRKKHYSFFSWNTKALFFSAKVISRKKDFIYILHKIFFSWNQLMFCFFNFSSSGVMEVKRSEVLSNISDMEWWFSSSVMGNSTSGVEAEFFFFANTIYPFSVRNKSKTFLLNNISK